ncbi:hypothetical protein KAR91_37360 [Candidatus Pacearchaeota archaeon]|nr:hypothetical protein [Candidatus Pacearchaeota archaeon]
MALTGIELKINRSEFSRFEPSRKKIIVRVLPTLDTGLAGEAVKVSLCRKDGLEVSFQDLVLTGDYPKGKVIQFDISEIKDADGFIVCTEGEYYVKAVQGSIEAKSQDLHISIITVEEMRKGYAYGCTLFASDVKAPKKQPTAVTGVTITTVSGDTPSGLYNLVYVQATGKLSWGGGQTVTLNEDVSEEVLPGQRGIYVEVEIDHFELPAADASEAILIDLQTMSDESIREEIKKSVAEIESYFDCFLEPKRIATEPYFSNPEAGEWFDHKPAELAFYSKDFNMNMLAWHLNLPVNRLRKINGIIGYVGNTPALEIKSGGFAVTDKSGTVDILPYNSEYSQFWTFWQHINFWGHREMIPGFWRYKGVAGLDTLTGDILKLIGYTAAIPLLTIAGQAYRAGYASESNSKDGVSRSVSYTSSATFGIYSATTKEFSEWIKLNKKRLRGKNRGVAMVVM